MDIDISDILADISRPNVSSLPDTSSPYGGSYVYEPSIAATDHILLTRHWTSERCTPSLLAYPTALINRVMDRIRAQITRIEDLASGTYSNDYGHHQQQQPQQNLNLVLSILQTDLSRTQFLMRSYLRCRLAKITTSATYYSKYHVNSSTSSSDTDTKTPLLSEQETQYLQHHNHLLLNLYNSSFLLSLPPNLRRLDDNTGTTGRMDEGPDMAAAVMVRCLAKEWNNETDVFADDGLEGGGQGTQGDVTQEENASVELRCERGGVLVARWRDVKSGVEKEALEVL
ncbi:hypothetical protein LTS08_006547 [Lithohypha guttulata]|nr:hypothetical protein LTS08_006547 [Lithohypha guttulata]